MKKLMLLSLLVVGCTKPFAPRIGEHVSNGVCSGWIARADRNEVRVVPWRCKNVSFNFAWVPKSELHSIEPGTQAPCEALRGGK